MGDIFTAAERKELADIHAGRVVHGRYMYRRPGESGYLLLCFGSSPLNTRGGHDALVKEWNRRDRGRWEWRWGEVLPGDIDHPDNRAKFDAFCRRKCALRRI